MFMILTDLLFGSLKSVAGIFQFDFLLSSRKILDCLAKVAKYWIIFSLFCSFRLKYCEVRVMTYVIFLFSSFSWTPVIVEAKFYLIEVLISTSKLWTLAQLQCFLPGRNWSQLDFATWTFRRTTQIDAQINGKVMPSILHSR